MNALAYVRVSGIGQIDGDGPVRQQKAIDDFCEAHKISPCQTFFEGGVSGTTEGMERDCFVKLITFFRQQPDPENYCLIVERMDRLARDLMVSELILRECRALKLKVYACDQGQLIDMASDEGDPTRKLIRQIMGALAEWDRSITVRKLRMSRERVRAAGKQCEGQPVFGARPGELIVRDWIVKLSQERGEDATSVAEQMNQKGYRTRTGKLWSAHLVRNVLNRSNGKKPTKYPLHESNHHVQ